VLKRELEIIKLIGEGFNTSKISKELNISEKTVLTHRKNILKKSEFKNTTGLVANCIRKGYI
jgi:DNA-binding NarL/FixJ family response regulator